MSSRLERKTLRQRYTASDGGGAAHVVLQVCELGVLSALSVSARHPRAGLQRPLPLPSGLVLPPRLRAVRLPAGADGKRLRTE